MIENKTSNVPEVPTIADKDSVINSTVSDTDKLKTPVKQPIIIRQVRTMDTDIADYNGTPVQPNQKAARDIQKPTFAEPKELSGENLTNEQERALEQENIGIEKQNEKDRGEQTIGNAGIIANPFVKEPSQQTPKHLISPLQTYTEDVAEAVKDKGSIIKIAVAQSQKKESEEHLSTDTRSYKNIIILFSSNLLILTGIGALYYYTNHNFKIKSFQTAPSLTDSLNAEKEDSIEINPLSDDAKEQFNTLFQKKLAIQINPESVEHIKVIDQRNNNEVRPNTILNLFSANIPPFLARSVNSYYLGIHNMHSGNTPFILFSVESYENASAGMLLWEETLIRDVQSIFLKKEDQLTIIPTDTGTNAYTFEDVYIKNNQARIVKNKNNEIILLYAFIDDKHLILTTNELTFEQIVGRLRSSQFVR